VNSTETSDTGHIDVVWTTESDISYLSNYG